MEVNADVRPGGRKPARRQAKTPVTISLGPELIKRVDAWAQRRNLSRSGVVSMALTEKLDEWEREQQDSGSRHG
jgi:metal-responsive CopG/Arc/MetJ family transcriptional regulator